MSETKEMMLALQRVLRRRERDIVGLLGQFVRCESPSHHKAAVDRLGAIVASEWRRRGASVRMLPQKTRGDHVRAEIWMGSGRPAGQILIIGHLDTVYPLGTLTKMPFRVSGGRAWGPGTFDMKAGLAIALAAIDALARDQVASSQEACLSSGIRMKKLAARLRGARSSGKRGEAMRYSFSNPRLAARGG